MLFLTIGLVLLLAALVYIYMTWGFNHWQKRGVPGPKPKAFTGNYPNLYTMKRHAIYDIQDIYRDYKQDYDAVGIFGGRAPQLLILSPQLARRVFVTDFKHFHDNEISKMVDEESDFIFANNPFSLVGEVWKERRADVTPGLTMGRIKTVYPVTNKVCKQLSDFIKKQTRIEGSNGVEAKDISLRFTSEMVTDCVLGLSAQSFSDTPTPIMANVKNLFDQSWQFIVYFVLLSLFPALLYIKRLRFIPKSVEHFFVDLMQNAIDTRRKQQEEGGKHFQRVDFLDYIIQLANKRQLNTRQLTAHTMTFLLDGFETTAGILAHLLLFLGRDERVQQKLREEVTAHLESGQDVINFDKLHELPYLDACIQETIRHFPPGHMSNKLCTEPLEIPNKNGPNFVIEKGTTIIVPHYCYMHDEEHFSNPAAFEPERFMETDAVKIYRERGVFMAFGDGPRVCIGMRFAMAQIKAAVVEVITHFNITANAKTRKDNLLDRLFFLARLDGGIWLNFEERK
ncbi:probable cytochrome P450 28a5 [Scaptodrosophila lebanonensis]|uniref:Probable cytochrome P450 28a5 n=1 Tax=Drosophila lebanonensis TaxID=7225 RepID=A0A6J2TN74_DROLE|nr:probable cytochrome P450 28a5 [Scaptodrosophila lebanonensis]